MKAPTCYLQYMPRSDSGYMECHVEFPDGNELFVNRIHMGSTTNYPSYATTGGIQAAMSVVCVCTGYTTAEKIIFRPMRGTAMLMGLGFKTEDRDIANAFVHSDNITGTPSTLSDGRIKDNVTSLDPSNCLSFCSAISPALYLQTLANEVRTGLVAQEVQTALQAHSLPETPVLDTKRARVDEDSPTENLMAMRYERLVPMLLGAVKALTARVAELESRLQ